MMNVKKSIYGLVFVGALVLSAYLFLFGATDGDKVPLRVGIAPYQDIAMLVNAEPLGLEERYGTDIELVTLGWEEILPSVASAGKTIDVGFGSYIEYLTKQENINSGSSDPVLFVYPLYVFKGGAFVTFDEDIDPLSKETIQDAQTVRSFLKHSIGAQRQSVYEMILYYLANQHGVSTDSLRIVDTALDNGFLAAEGGSIDIAAAGLTQLTEARRLGGHSVLTMEDIGFADITGFIVRKSVYEARKKEVQDLVRMWFDSVAYVYEDIEVNSKYSLSYLNAQASTQYSLQEYQQALSQEYLPTTPSEAAAELIAADGTYSYRRIGMAVSSYLVDQKITRNKPELPVIEVIE